MIHETATFPDTDTAAYCKNTSIRVLKHLSKAQVELPEGVSLVNNIHQAALNEIMERTVLKTK